MENVSTTQINNRNLFYRHHIEVLRLKMKHLDFILDYLFCTFCITNEQFILLKVNFLKFFFKNFLIF